MDVEHRFRFSPPGRRLAVHIEDRRAGARFFDATLSLERRPMTPGWRAWMLVRYPFMTEGSEQKSRLLARSARQGLGMSALYPAPVDQIPELKELFAGKRAEGARFVAERLVTLPTHHFVTESDVARIVAALWP
jgi:dTDP-4-amino-4,6-dideoxygalactose transaminase